MSYLVVVAHPDDEALGMGGTIYKIAKLGKKVYVCILSGDADARLNRPIDDRLEKNTIDSLKILGANLIITGGFPNIKMNTVPHIELVKFIERAIVDTKAEVIITHHPADLNNDHHHTSVACQAAARIFQRRTGIVRLKELLFMEVLSSTEWGLNASLNQFIPNTYVEIHKTGVEKKIEAVLTYEGVMRDYPHPRSKNAIMALAILRGSQAGLKYAEAFQSVFKINI